VTSKEGLQLLNYTPKRYVCLSLLLGFKLMSSVQVDREAERWLRDLEGDEEYALYAEQPED
jgi:hypothetical protein